MGIFMQYVKGGKTTFKKASYKFSSNTSPEKQNCKTIVF